ncbi:MAG: hypothetical protein K6U80_17880 [Firmicutes bacterium]|nr:hypothetical protein [Bacillota bacterium]
MPVLTKIHFNCTQLYDWFLPTQKQTFLSSGKRTISEGMVAVKGSHNGSDVDQVYHVSYHLPEYDKILVVQKAGPSYDLDELSGLRAYPEITEVLVRKEQEESILLYDDCLIQTVWENTVYLKITICSSGKYYFRYIIKNEHYFNELAGFIVQLQFLISKLSEGGLDCDLNNCVCILDELTSSLCIHESIGHLVELDNYPAGQKDILKNGLRSLNSDSAISVSEGNEFNDLYDDLGYLNHPIQIMSDGKFVNFLDYDSGKCHAKYFKDLPLIRNRSIRAFFQTKPPVTIDEEQSLRFYLFQGGKFNGETFDLYDGFIGFKTQTVFVQSITIDTFAFIANLKPHSGHTHEFSGLCAKKEQNNLRVDYSAPELCFLGKCVRSIILKK